MATALPTGDQPMMCIHDASQLCVRYSPCPLDGGHAAAYLSVQDGKLARQLSLSTYNHGCTGAQVGRAVFRRLQYSRAISMLRPPPQVKQRL